MLSAHVFWDSTVSWVQNEQSENIQQSLRLLNTILKLFKVIHMYIQNFLHMSICKKNELTKSSYCKHALRVLKAISVKFIAYNFFHLLLINVSYLLSICHIFYQCVISFINVSYLLSMRHIFYQCVISFINVSYLVNNMSYLFNNQLKLKQYIFFSTLSICFLTIIENIWTISKWFVHISMWHISKTNKIQINVLT